MAYDAAKAHEYYVNYRKKGIKKGRKKGKAKTETTAFLGVSAQGFNDEGRMQAAIIKENIKKEMKAALAGAKTDEERQKIRLEYSKKAQQEINKLKSNPQYAKAKASKASKASGSKGSAGKASNTSSKKSTKAAAKAKPTMSAQMSQAISNMQNKINDILSSNKIENLTDKEKADLRAQLSGMLAKIKKMYK